MWLRLSFCAPLKYQLGRKILQWWQSLLDKSVRQKNMELISLNSWYDNSFCALKRTPEEGLLIESKGCG
jgi:hypothetical protein